MLRIHQLSLGVQELEAGPFLFLLSHSTPVAYVDRRPEAMAPGVYRSDVYIGKATTRHQNKWLQDKKPYATIPHDLVVKALDSISKYAEQPVHDGASKRLWDATQKAARSSAPW
jgi:hypothetical protein